MGNPIIQEKNYREIKRRAKALYSTIKNVWCPALSELITFNSLGFKHLAQKGRKFRPISEQIRRFTLLKYVESILTGNKASVFHESKVIHEKRVDFWKFTEKRDELIIKVVIRQVGNGKKHFWSIYGRYQKTAK